MRMPERQLWLYTAFILIAAVLASHQFVGNKELTGYVIQEVEQPASATSDNDVAPVMQQETIKVPFSVESLGYVFLLALLLGGVYFMLVLERVKNKLLKR